MLTRELLEAFLEVIEHGSIQKAARDLGRSRATYQRALSTLEESLGGCALLERRAGQRQAQLTPAGRELERRARAMLEAWDRWEAQTRRLLAEQPRQVRVGALAGAFDLLADLVLEVSQQIEGASFVLVEHPADALPEAVATGAVDFGLGTPTQSAAPADFEPVGPLPWSVILPAAWAPRFGPEIHLADLHDVPMVLPRAGPVRQLLARCFELHEAGPLTLRPAVEAESTPRIVDMVAKGFGPAIVTRFRTRYLPEQGVEVRRLLDGPAPLVAGLYTRDVEGLPEGGQVLLQRIRAALEEVVEPRA